MKHFLSPSWTSLVSYKGNALAPVVQTLDSAFQGINHYPANNCKGNQLHYPLEQQLYLLFGKLGTGEEVDL